MSGLEAAAIAVGTAVARTACGVWLGDHKLAAEAGAGLIDLAAERLTGAREKRQFRRVWEQAAELVADRVQPLVVREFRDLPEHERLAALDAVRDTFTAAALTEADLFARDLDAGFLDRHLRGQDPDRAGRAGLAAAAVALYDLLLRECCAYTIEVVRTLPGSGLAALTELLRRERQILDDLGDVLERLPARRGVADFARDYRQLVANQLDQVEFFGATLSESSRRYPLSVAYLSLTVSGEFTLRRPGERPGEQLLRPGRDSAATSPTARVDDVLAATRRLFVRGQAGLGKTTLLQWIAVQSARGSFPDHLAGWNGTVPFFIPLRRHATGELPGPQRFISEVGRHIAEEMPPGWVQQQLRAGHAVVLVDGVDELAEQRRDEVRRWLRQLIATFPDARYVVTSRPAAAPADWLGREDFDVAELDPMTAADVPVFVRRWHDAMREQSSRADERAELTDYQQHLLDALAAQRHLRHLAGYPLLCALLCALHRDRRAQLPGNRMELYEVALQMLLERRDRERRLDPVPMLSRTDKTLLLRDIAYWLIRNGWSAAPAERVRERIAAKLRAMTQVRASADEVYRMLLERSGLLREPVQGQTDFIHRSFQEYLAAAEAVDTDDLGVLIAGAYTDVWTDVVVLAAGHASAAKRAELLRGLLDRSGQVEQPRIRDSLRLVAVACLETSPELPPDLRADIERAAAGLLPPRTMAAARSLARAGSFTVDLLARTEPTTVAEVTATIRAAAEIGDPVSLRVLAQFGADPRRAVVTELLRAWPRFDPEEYARTVLRDCPLHNGRLELHEARPLPGLPHLIQLKDLYCNYANSAEALPLLANLPHLTDLTVDDDGSATLAPLRDTALRRFLVWGHDRPGVPALDLTPLATTTALRDLAIWTRPVTSIRALASLRTLQSVILTHLGSTAALAELSPLTDLYELGIGNVHDLTSLAPLAFLRAPASIRLADCPVGGEELRFLERWANSLTWLSLRHLEGIDLRQLTGLGKLRWLTLYDLSPSHPEALAALPRLETLTLDRTTNLAGLPPMPNLRQLELWQLKPIDLTPLAGVTGLTIKVLKGTVVHGADRLGPGSRIRRGP